MSTNTPNALRAAVGAQPAQPAAEPRNPYDALKRKLEVSKAEFLPLMGGSQANVDAFIRVVLNAVMGNPALLHADQRSLIVACMKAAQDGLMPDGREAVLNIYSTKVKEPGSREERWVDMVQYLPMVGGLIKLMYLSGEILSLDAAVVFENDKFRFVRGDNPCLEHEPTLADEPGGIIAAYAVVKLKNGEIKREVMPWRDIAMVRAASKNPDGANSPWVKWLDQMAIKSVIKRINKQLPKSDRFDQADASDNQAMGFAATPESIGDIAARSYTAGPAAAQAAPAVAHQPAETIDFGAGTDQREHVEVGRREEEPEQRQQQRHDEERPAFNEAAFGARVARCNDTQALDLMADDIRSVEDPQVRVRLGALIEQRRMQLDTPQNTQPPVNGGPVQRRAGSGARPSMG